MLKKSYVWIRTISPFSVACCLISNFLHRAFEFGLHLIQQCTKRCVVRSFEFYGTFFVRMYLITKKSHNFIFYLLKSAWITTKPQYVTGTDKFASALQLLLFFMEHRLIILSLELSSLIWAAFFSVRLSSYLSSLYICDISILIVRQRCVLFRILIACIWSFEVWHWPSVAQVESCPFVSSWKSTKLQNYTSQQSELHTSLTMTFFKICIYCIS